MFKIKVSTLRRISQIFFFVLLVFTSYIIVIQIDTPLFPFIESPQDYEYPEWYNPPAKYVQVLDTYGPVKTCRFIGGESRVFRGCFMHFLPEALTWATPLTMVIPHVLFYVILAFLLGRAFCGWFCPLGFLQDVMGTARKYLGVSHWQIPENVLSFMAKFRYAFVSLVVIVALAVAIPALGMTFLQAEFSIIGCETCPSRIIMPLFSGNSPGYYSFSTPLYAIFTLVGIAFLALFFSGFVFKRPFCRICPSGTLLSLFNVGSLLSKEKDVQKCTKCGICARVCPMDNKNVYREKANKKIDSANCVRCFSCIENCPEKDCLKLNFAGKSIMRSGKKLTREPKSKKKRKPI